MKKQDKNCIFCKIIKGEISCDKIFENKNFLVFLDIKPVNHGHLLVIPKEHVVWMQEADDKTIAGIFKLTKKMMLALKKGLGCDYVRVAIVGNEVPHFHVHLIPGYHKEKLINFPTKKYASKEAEATIKKIVKAI